LSPATSNSRLSRFTEVDVSSANNDNNGYYNASNYPNSNAFAALKTDGSITAWGDSLELPHIVIEPSILRAAKAAIVE
jgi:hypothetical protein